MATIKLKRGTSTPTTSNITSGEVAIDTSAKKFYVNDGGTIKEIGGGGGGGGTSFSTFSVDTMTGDGSDTTLTLSASPDSENNTQVYIDGVYQPKSTYSVSGTTLTFGTAPPNGTAVEVTSSPNVTFASNTMTGDGSDTTLTLSANPGTENNTLLFVGGVYQPKSTYSVSGTTLTFSAAPPNNASVEAMAGASTDTFTIASMTGDGSDTTLTLSANPGTKKNTLLFVGGVYQPKSSYSISGTTLTFNTAPPTGTSVEAIIGDSTNVNVPEDDTVTSAKLSGDLTTPGNLTVNGITDTTNFKVGGAQGSDGQVLTSTGSGVAWENAAAGGIASLVADTSPQLGGTLDANSNTIDMGTNVITDTKVGQWDTAYSWGNHASSGYATLASPTLTGTPLAPTASASTNTTQIATTAFVGTAVSNLVDSSPSALNTLNELAAALGDDASFSTTVTNSIATKLPLAGGTLTGALTLGGNLNVGAHDIVTSSNGNIELDPNGSGKVVFKGNSTKGAGQFVLNCEQNSHGITIKGPPHSAAASYTLTLPNDDGSADQVLKTDGSGVLSWADAAGGGVTGITSFTSTSEIMRLSSGNKISIGQNAGNALALLQLYQSGSGDLMKIQNANGAAQIVFTNGSNNETYFGLDGSGNIVIDGVENNSFILSTNNTERLRVLNSGNVGIGTTTPTQALDVNGTVELNNLTVGGAQGSDGQVLTSTGSGVGWEDAGGGVDGITSSTTTTTIKVEKNSNIPQVGIGEGVTPEAVLEVYSSGTSSSKQAFLVSTQANYTTLKVMSNGIVGIRKTPLSSGVYGLDVEGEVRFDDAINITNLRIGNATTTANNDQGTDGQVLTSTGSGIAWEDPGAPSTPGLNNVRLGTNAGASFNNYAERNVAIGVEASQDFITDGQTQADDNVALGYRAMGDGRSPNANVAIGAYALEDIRYDGTSFSFGSSTSQGAFNIAIGYKAAIDARKNNGLIAIGYETAKVLGSTSSYASVGVLAIGHKALYSNTGQPSDLCIVGNEAMYNYTLSAAAYTCAIGYKAGYDVTTGFSNTFLGNQSGDNITTGDYNTIIGWRSKGTADVQKATVLGGEVTASGDETFTFGYSSNDSAIANGGTTITAPSDERYKEDITDSTAGLSFIKDLRPVTFRWKKEKDLPTTHNAYVEDSEVRVMNDKTNHGFIAQEVKAVIDSHSEIKDGFDMWREDATDGRQRIGPAALIPIFVKAIQELEARVNELENK